MLASLPDSLWATTVPVGDASMVIRDMHRAVSSESPGTHAPAEVKQGNAMPSCFSSHTANKCPSCSRLTAHFFSFFCLFLVISLSEMTPKSSGLVLFSVPKFKKAVICQLGLDEHHPG